MAHDILGGKTKSDWSRSEATVSSLGYNDLARDIFERGSRPPQPVVVVQKASGPSWFSVAVGVILGTKVLSGQWPWHIISKKLEAHKR